MYRDVCGVILVPCSGRSGVLSLLYYTTTLIPSGVSGALGAPETPDAIRNLKTSVPATRGFHTDGHHVQLRTEQMFRQHRFPCKFS